MDENKAGQKKIGKIEKIKTFFVKEHTPLEKGLMVATALCTGIIIGFVASPIKRGVAIGSNNGCENTVLNQKSDKE